jgi:hypothetical protein
MSAIAKSTPQRSVPAKKTASARLALERLGTGSRFFGTAALLFILLFLRRPDAVLNAQFWAEDGSVFFKEQVVYGFLRAAVTPYADYLNFVPRLTATFGSLLPAVWVPLAFNLTALLIAAICCSLFVLPAYRYILESDLQRFLVCILVACALYTDEVVANITDIQVYLAIGGILIAFYRSPSGSPPRLRNAILIGIAGVAIACTCPVSVVLLPWLLWQLLRRRSTDRVWLGLMTGGVALQMATILSHHSDSVANWNQTLTSELISFVYRVVFPQIGGVLLVGRISHYGTGGAVLLTLIAITFWFTWLYYSSDRRSRRTVLVCLYLLLASLGMAMAGRGEFGKRFLTLLSTEEKGERLFVVPSCILVLLVALSIRKLWPTAHPAAGGLLLCLAFSGGLLANFRVRPFENLHWAESGPQIDVWRRAWNTGQPVKGLFARTPPAPYWGVKLPSRLAAAKPDSPWEGLLVTVPGKPEAFLIRGGQKQPILDPACIPKLGLHWDDDLVQISAGNLSRIPAGSAIGPCPTAHDGPLATFSAVSVTPSFGNLATARFTAVYRHSAGFDHFNLVQFYMPGNGGTGKNACWAYYKPDSKALWLTKDGQDGALGPLTPGSNQSVENSQCTLHANGSSVSGMDNDLTVTYALSFKKAFAGHRDIFLYGQDLAWHGTGWQLRGAWSVPSASLRQ